MSDPTVDVLRIALGQDHIDRRGDLRRAGWDAVPTPRKLVVIDPDGNVALQPTDRTAAERPPPLLAAEIPAEPHAAEDLFLGVDATGTAIVGRMVSDDDAPVGVGWGNLRTIGMRLDEEQRGIVVELVALAAWHRTHRHCPRCGSATDVGGLGWWRSCPRDSTEHYPRTDPAIIALLLDDEGNALLGRQARWPVGAFSTLAGFVEAGESAEAAVAREIHEEVGLTPVATQYLGSQPWPFPSSLMLGFHARVPGVRPEPLADGYEIAEARWLSRAELGVLAEAREVRLPGRLSIAHHLIGRWYGAPIPDAWCRW